MRKKSNLAQILFSLPSKPKPTRHTHQFHFKLLLTYIKKQHAQRVKEHGWSTLSLSLF